MIKIFVTGPPGVGKTTCVYKIYEMLKLYKYRVGGFITREIRENNKRVGFKLVNLDDGFEDWLANIYDRKGLPLGKYHVFVDKLDNFLERIENKLEKYDVIIIDEIGPMEMMSEKFREVVKYTLSLPIPSIYTVHHKISKELRRIFETKYENILYMITRENRDGVPLLIWNEINKYIGR